MREITTYRDAMSRIRRLECILAKVAFRIDARLHESNDAPTLEQWRQLLGEIEGALEGKDDGR